MNVFIVGSPRSGTTLLGEILDAHPSICCWYEPHFVINRHFRTAPDDVRHTADATPEVASFISTQFERYRAKRGCSILVDKSPTNSLKIPFLRAIFPQGRFIHILRDGRDATLSINREWQRRREILSDKTRASNVLRALRLLYAFINRQDRLEDKLRALLFELQVKRFLLRGPMGLLWRVDRWNGEAGWGPQFADWATAFRHCSTLAFNAMQWTSCVRAVREHGADLETDQFLQIRYEALLDDPEEILRVVCDFLEVPFPNDFMAAIPQLRRGNYGKWAAAFSPEEKAGIGPILHPLLEDLGYADSRDWYEPSPPSDGPTIDKRPLRW